MKKWIWLILVLSITLGTSQVCGSDYNPVNPSNDLKFPRAFVQYYRGADGLYYDTGILFISGTVAATNTVMVSDTVTCDSMAINPYTDTTKSLTGVKQLYIIARSGIDVRVAIAASGTTTGNNYEIVYAGSPLILKDLNGISITIAAKGNDATAGDTGIFSIRYCQ